MTKIFRVVGWALAALAALLVIGALAAHVLAERKMNRKIDVQVAPVAFVDDPAAITRGEYLFRSRGCGDCHAENGGGRLFIDAPNGLRVETPNITPGPGSAVANYREVDWVRTVRHGIKPDGRPLRFMPSEDYNRMTDVDLAALVAYTRRLPPVAGSPARIEAPMIVKALYAAGVIPDAPEKIDHGLPPEQPVAEGVTAAHGEYVANMCKGCHGVQLRGGKIPGAPPEWPAAPDLTVRATYAAYPEEQAFRRMMRTGKRPDGSAVQVMPFETLREINDVDVGALYLYLTSLPAR